jgi:hypothetical protein
LKAVQSVTAYGLQILDGTAHTHACVDVMIVVLSTVDMSIRITREWPPMSKTDRFCPRCVRIGSLSRLCSSEDFGCLYCPSCSRMYAYDRVPPVSEVSADE